MAAPFLDLQQISKSYQGVRALDCVDLRLDAGQIHALIGKNGAGKSTLIKILGGVVRPDGGTIRIREHLVTFASPAEAIRQGVAIVHQELSMVSEMTVAENLMLGTWPRARFGQVNKRRLRAEALDALAKVRCDVDPAAPVRSLSIAQQQLVEIARALLRNPRVLVFDEPTSSLSDSDAERVTDLARHLAGQGVGIIYISHRLAEIEAIADVVTVLRDGRSVVSRPMAGLDRNQIVTYMIGEVPVVQPVRRVIHATPSLQTVPLLRIRNLGRSNVLHDISFDVHRGEILGIAGLVGAGRTELVRAVFGRDAISAGTIEVDGTMVPRPTPRIMRQLGVGLIPEDRKGQGLVLGLSIRNNASLAFLGPLSTAGVVRMQDERRAVDTQLAALQVKAANAGLPVSTLSGGNQQKVVLAKWLMRKPKLLILDEPTRGVDVQAKAQIFDILRRLANNGTGIILISSELEEVLFMSDRIMTMARGHFVSETLAKDARLQDILMSAAGS